MTSFLNKIHNGKCEDLIPKIPDNLIDLVITSPPYNVDLGNNRFNNNKYDIYEDNMSYKKYIEWLYGIFNSIKPKMVSGGRICINIGDRKNGSIPVHSDIIQFMTKELGYLIKTTIIWHKNQVRNRCAWGSFVSPNNPSFPTPFEYILIFCKDTQFKTGDKKDITITKEEFINNSLASWSFGSDRQMNKVYNHPAMFPLELPHRLIQQLSYKGDVVVDIFSGMGTTCLAAAMLDRQWIGLELSKYYTNKSIERIKVYTEQSRLF